MKIKLPEMDALKFYTIGKYCFFVSGLIGLIKVVDLWDKLASYDIFSSLASALFNFVLALFFANLGKKEMIRELSDEDAIKINNAINKLNLEGGKNAKKGIWGWT